MKSQFPVVRSQAFPFPEGFTDGERGGYVNKKTGEISFPPSVVDSSEYEELSSLVAKLMRGGSASISSRNPVFEVEPGSDPMEAIRNFDETRREGFDLADAARIAADVKEVAEADVEVRKKKLLEDEARLKKDEEDLKEFRRKEKKMLKELDEAEPSEHQEDPKGPAGGK